MGLQITVMLTIVIYIDVIQNSIPVYGSIMETPLLLSNFVTTTCLLTACLLVSTRTLFLEHVQLYEVCNFTRQRAKDSVNIGWCRWKLILFQTSNRICPYTAKANFLNKIGCGYWRTEIPKRVINLQHYSSPFEKETQPEELVKAFQFYATMIDRLTFIIIVMALAVNNIVTFSIILYNYNTT